MKKKMMLLVGLLALTSCGGTSESASTESTILPTARMVTDMVGREVVLEKEDYSRVLCIGAGALRLYSYVGDMEKLCGAEDIDRGVEGANPFASISRPYYDVNKELLDSLPSCGKGGPKNQAAEAETILGLNPDIIISEYGDVTAEDALQEKVGVPVITLSYGANSVFDDKVQNSLALLGEVFHKEEKATALKAYIKNSEKELGEKTKDIKEEDKKSVYIGGLGNWGTQDIYSTSPSFPLFNVSGIKNAIQGSSLTNGKIEKETLVSTDPDIIVLDAAGIQNIKNTYNSDKETFDNLSAFKNNEVYLEMPFNAYYTNLEVALMDAYFLASVAFPEQYQNFDMASKADEISDAFLDKPCYDIIKSKPNSFGGFQKIEDIKTFLAA